MNEKNVVITKEVLREIFEILSDEQINMIFSVAVAFSENNFDIMPESALDFFASDEKASEETKEKARIALAKKRGEAVECCR